jgi:glycerate-2-kinase
MISFKVDVVKNGKSEATRKARSEVLEMVKSAIEAVDSYKVVKRALKISGDQLDIQKSKFDLNAYKNIYLIGFGKASLPMAKAVSELVNISNGIVITPELDLKPVGNIKVRYGSHPIPTQANLDATKEAIEIAKNSKQDDLLLVLISGGGSALLSKPRIPLKDLRLVTELLLKSGCTITELNAVRKHLSWVKGGQLAKFAKSTLISLIISDIIDDPIDGIASGPTYPDSTTFKDAKAVLECYDLLEKVPPSVYKIIKDGIGGKSPETPKEIIWPWKRVHNYIIANNKLACLAACIKAKNLGYKPILFSSAISGEAKEAGKKIVYQAKSYKEKKIALIGGGETTVKVKGKGKGGRNQEIVLGAVEAITNKPMIIASFGTDGIDGNTEAAGAIADGDTYKSAIESHLAPKGYLKRNDSYTFFKEMDDLLITGPTHTNVMDIQILLLYK